MDDLIRVDRETVTRSVNHEEFARAATPPWSEFCGHGLRGCPECRATSSGRDTP